MRSIKRRKTLMLEALKSTNDVGKLASKVYNTSPKDKKARIAAAKLRYLVMRGKASPETK